MSRRRAMIPFLSLEMFLYILFLLMDFSVLSDDSTIPKYYGILLCVFNGWILYCNNNSKNLHIPLAITLTAAADYFLLVLNRHYTVGVAVFVIVQGIYGHFLWQLKRLVHFLRIILPLGMIAYLAAMEQFTVLNILAAIYFSQLIINAVQAWVLHIHSHKSGMSQKSSLCFALGLTLFVCCDVCVGLFNLNIISDRVLSQFVTIGMWLFYLPSQVLITLSGLGRKGEL